MKLFSLFRKAERAIPSLPLWSITLQGKVLNYRGEDVHSFSKNFDLLEQDVHFLWNASELTQNDYNHLLSEIKQAKEIFIAFVLKSKSLQQTVS